MAALMDVISSMIFGSTLFMIILTSNDIATETQATYNGDMMVQEMLTGTAQLIEGEFRNMGYNVPQTVASITHADSTGISFLLDLDRNGTIDTVKYTLGDITELSGTPNELDRFLKRQVNGGTVLKVGVVTVFHLTYLTSEGVVIPSPVPSDRLGEVRMVELTMEVQNPYAPARIASMVQSGERNALYSSSLWQQTRLASQNTRR
jgi:hypothetical protein